MIFLSGHVHRDLHWLEHFGFMRQPTMGNKIPLGHPWAADNGCFRKPESFDPNLYIGWLSRQDIPSAMFAVAPDVPYDMKATLKRSPKFFDPIRKLGYRVALAVQEGATPDNLPWGEFEVMFIGGDDDWKEGPEVLSLCDAAHERGVDVHMARVNGGARAQIAMNRHCTSIDGTLLAFGRDINLPKVKAWIRFLNYQGQFAY